MSINVCMHLCPWVHQVYVPHNNIDKKKGLLSDGQ